MFKRALLFFLFLTITLENIYSQELGRPFIENFNRKHYGASLSNWQVTQDDRGLIYAANLDGILSYDGNMWDLTSVNSSTQLFSVYSNDLKRVFYGGKKEYGYLTTDDRGKNKLISLVGSNNESDLGTVFSIISRYDTVYFKSLTEIIRLSKNDFKTWRTRSTILQPMLSYDGSVFSALDRNGIIKFSGDSVLPLINDFDNGGLRFIMSLPKDDILIGTLANGIYKRSKNGIYPVTGDVNKFLKKNSMFAGLENPISNNYILGTLRGGIVCVNRNFNIERFISKEHGIKSNIIKHLLMDDHQNLWAATQEGVSYIELNSPLSFWDENSGLSGTPWSLGRYQESLFIGTTNGLFKMKNNDIQLFDGIDSKVWSLKAVVDKRNNTEKFFIGTDKGLFEIRDKELKKISEFAFVNKIHFSEFHNLLIIGHRDGLSVLDLSSETEEFETFKKLENATILQIQEDSANNLWFSVKSEGIYRVSFINKDQRDIRVFNKKDGFPDVNAINMFEQGGRVYFTTRNGMYYLSDSGTLEPDSVLLRYKFNLNFVTKDFYSDYYTVKTSPDNSQKLLKLVSNDSTFKIVDTPFRRLPEMEFEVIYPEEDGVVWIGGSEGLFRYDPKVKKDYTLPFNTLVRRATTSDSVIFYGNYSEPVEGSEIPRIVLDQPKSYIPKLPYENNNITFQYSATSYEASERNEFSHYLQNNEKTWSAWSTETKKEYNNLEPGRYTFHVKSKNIYDTIGRTASYEFVILPPWYMTTWAYSIFTILIALAVWFIAMLYSFRVRLHRRRLKLLVADRTYEVITQKREIEQQRDQLKDKNDEITSQRDAIQEKNKLLERSKSEILTMNESLKGLNSSLEKEVEKRTSRIKTTLKKLQQTNMELDTFIYRASHDLKGPISRISGLTSLAKLEAPDDAYEKYFSLIELTTLEMESLLAKLTQVHEVLNKRVVRENVEIPSLLHEVRESVKYLNQGEKTTYSFDLDPDVTIKSDKYLLRIILQNILENALIFRKSDRYDHHIHIETRKQEQWFVVKVKDTGIGMKEDQHNEVYKMFYRGSDKSKGNGLGLYLVKSSMDKLRGRVKINSVDGSYTEFEIQVPLN